MKSGISVKDFPSYREGHMCLERRPKDEALLSQWEGGLLAALSIARAGHHGKKVG